jgi:hypothetical protein
MTGDVPAHELKWRRQVLGFIRLLPHAALLNQTSQLLQPHPVHIVEAPELRTININNRHNTPLISLPGEDGHDNLALAVAVAGDVAGEGLDVRDELCLPRGGGGATYAAVEENGLAGDLALEGAENEAARGGGVEDVEAGPVDGA